MSTYPNDNLIAIERHGPNNYRLLELPVREKWEIWQSHQMESQSEAFDLVEGHWDNDYRQVAPETIATELAERQKLAP